MIIFLDLSVDSFQKQAQTRAMNNLMHKTVIRVARKLAWHLNCVQVEKIIK